MEFLDKIPQPLYKYRQWSELGKEEQFQKRILTHNEIYLASPNQFNDPFDSALPFRYDEKKLTPEKIFKKLWETGKRNYKDITDEKLRKKCYEQLHSGRFENGTYWKEYYEEFKEENNKNFGILSLTAKRDNLLMWSHYADSHKGFCVGFDKSKLFETIKGSIGPIIYQSEIPSIGLFEDSLKAHTRLSMTKSKEWEYEEEYRITKIYAARKVYHFPSDAILEVILGYNMSDSEKDEILKLVKKKFPKAKLYESKMSLEEFKLNMIPIF